MAIEIRLPSMLRKFTDSEPGVQIDQGKNVRDVLEQIVGKDPAFKEAIFDDEGIKGYLNIFLNNKDIRSSQGLDTPVRDGDEIFIVSSIAGG